MPSKNTLNTISQLKNLFEMTDRNLSYLLSGLAKKAAIKKKVSAQI